METLSGKNTDEYFKAMDDEIQSLLRRDTWGVVLRKSISHYNMFLRTWYSSSRGNLIGKPIYLRHNIFCERRFPEETVS